MLPPSSWKETDAARSFGKLVHIYQTARRHRKTLTFPDTAVTALNLTCHQVHDSLTVFRDFGEQNRARTLLRKTETSGISNFKGKVHTMSIATRF